ncbi:MAG: hypothetical protein CL608_26490 [Anaerolineaceae bacterium]|nr:hypothetical protein [Anaerolineaceae bacterium]
MSGLATAALILIAIWLGVLTVALVLTVRQIGILTVRLSQAGESFNVDTDGPEVGSDIPSEVRKILPGIETSVVNFILLSSNCNPCRELATKLDGHSFDAPVITLLAGRKELADGLASLLPSGFQVLRDPAASQVAAAFQIQSTPFAVAVAAGKVRSKAYLHSLDDLLALANGQKTRPPLREGVKDE